MKIKSSRILLFLLITMTVLVFSVQAHAAWKCSGPWQGQGNGCSQFCGGDNGNRCCKGVYCEDDRSAFCDNADGTSHPECRGYRTCPATECGGDVRCGSATCSADQVCQDDMCQPITRACKFGFANPKAPVDYVKSEYGGTRSAPAQVKLSWTDRSQCATQSWTVIRHTQQVGGQVSTNAGDASAAINKQWTVANPYYMPSGACCGVFNTINWTDPSDLSVDLKKTLSNGVSGFVGGAFRYEVFAPGAVPNATSKVIPPNCSGNQMTGPDGFIAAYQGGVVKLSWKDRSFCAVKTWVITRKTQILKGRRLSGVEEVNSIVTMTKDNPNVSMYPSCNPDVFNSIELMDQKIETQSTYRYEIKAQGASYNSGSALVTIS